MVWWAGIQSVNLALKLGLPLRSSSVMGATASVYSVLASMRNCTRISSASSSVQAPVTKTRGLGGFYAIEIQLPQFQRLWEPKLKALAALESGQPAS